MNDKFETSLRAQFASTHKEMDTNDFLNAVRAKHAINKRREKSFKILIFIALAISLVVTYFLVIAPIFNTLSQSGLPSSEVSFFGVNSMSIFLLLLTFSYSPFLFLQSKPQS